jgi:exopolysaccharide biosynthesis polyprenyl glycosylphosphotransferase
VHTSLNDSSDRFRRDYLDPLIPVQSVSYSVVKRFFDIAISLIVITCLSPVFIISAILVKLTSRGPVFFKQVRVSKGGRYFKCLKFRSMCVDAEEKKKELEHLNEVDGPVFKMKNDPRITRVGAVLRKLSIDELPQFFNVLAGDMSVVGPRPPLPTEVEQYSARHRARLSVMSGITCYWQIGGRSNLSFEEWMDLDLKYIEEMSFWTDVCIVLKTIPVVLLCRGAH